MNAKYCDECRYCSFISELKMRCAKGHKPKYFHNTTGNPHDTDWGWKRKCEDFEAKHETKAS